MQPNSKACSSGGKKEEKKMVFRSGRHLATTGVVGALVSAYGVYVEHQTKTHPERYTALCASPYFSCPTVLRLLLASQSLLLSSIAYAVC